MRSSRVKQYNDGMLNQEERKSKNFLTRRNLLNRSKVSTVNSQRRWMDHHLLLTARWWRGSGRAALMKLRTLSSEVSSLPTVEAWKAYPGRLWSSRWSSRLQIDWRAWGHLLRCTVTPLLRWRLTTWLARRRGADQTVFGRSAPSRPR
jgi:hypothetical protein